MKSFIVVILVFSLHFNAFSQENNKIELLDLMKIFLPDKAMNYNIYDWFTGTDGSVPIVWKTNGIAWKNEYAYRVGEAIVTINGKYFDCLGVKTEPCKWNITLKGSRSGYNTFNISSITHPDINSHYSIQDLLYEDEYNATLLKICDESHIFGFYLFQVEMPEKKDFWLLYSWYCGNAGCIISMDCSTDINEIVCDCWTE